MAGTLLCFNIAAEEKQTALRLLSLRLGLRKLDVPKEKQGCSIAALLDGTAEGKAPPFGFPTLGAFEDEMLVMAGLGSESFHMLLDSLRQNGQSVRLKAVVTDHNRSWTALRLHDELEREEKAIAAIKKKRK